MSLIKGFFLFAVLHRQYPSTRITIGEHCDIRESNKNELYGLAYVHLNVNVNVKKKCWSIYDVS